MTKGPAVVDETILLFTVERDSSVEARCPVCREGLEGVKCRLCPKCDTPHHAACWEYVGACAVFACGGKTPPAVRRAPDLVTEITFVDPLRRTVPRDGSLRSSLGHWPPQTSAMTLMICCLLGSIACWTAGSRFVTREKQPESRYRSPPGHSTYGYNRTGQGESPFHATPTGYTQPFTVNMAPREPARAPTPATDSADCRGFWMGET